VNLRTSAHFLFLDVERDQMMKHLHQTVVSAAIATTAALGTGAIAQAATFSTPQDFSRIQFQKTIVAGDPNGTPPDSPDNRVDPNTTTSPFAGVGSLSVLLPGEGNFLCTGTAISPIHVLTAGHCLDVQNDDGTIDLAPENVTFNLNFGGDLSHQITASQLNLFPEFAGFSNTIENDMGVVTLSQPLPAGVPIYPLYRDPITPSDTITMAGYGTTGNGTVGYTVPGYPEVKRVGQNQVEDTSLLESFAFLFPGLPDGLANVYLFDFDGPDASTNTFALLGSGLTLGNNIEANVASGDSGGPSFIKSGNTLFLAGVNTIAFALPNFSELSAGEQGAFGTGGGGVRLSNAAKLDWLDSFLALAPPPLTAGNNGGSNGGGNGNGSTSVPEPTTVAGLIAVGAGLLFSKRRKESDRSKS
jgi:V8-like Glu-specific endopeptidase